MLINEKYKIVSDELNLTLLKKVIARKEGVQDSWKPIAYASTIEGLVNVLIKREIFGTGFDDLQEINKKIEQLRMQVKEVIRDFALEDFKK